jgi:hypothetical protein
MGKANFIDRRMDPAVYLVVYVFVPKREWVVLYVLGLSR